MNKNLLFLLGVLLVLCLGSTLAPESVSLQGLTSRGYKPLKVDTVTQTLMTIDYSHHEIHGGSSFTAHYSVTTANDSDDRSAIYIKTPAAGGALCHMVASFASSASATYSICEAPTIAANIGTHTSVPYNRYRDSTGASGVFNNATSPAAAKYTTLTEAQIAADGTFATGTIIRTSPLTAGSGPQAAGGSSRDSQEYLLKAGVAYVFLLTNTAQAANTHHIMLDWYEHTNAN